MCPRNDIIAILVCAILTPHVFAAPTKPDTADFVAANNGAYKLKTDDKGKNICEKRGKHERKFPLMFVPKCGLTNLVERSDAAREKRKAKNERRHIR